MSQTWISRAVFRTIHKHGAARRAFFHEGAVKPLSLLLCIQHLAHA